MPVSDQRVYRFEPYADHFQFHLQDAEAGPGVDGDTWVKALQAWRIGPERHAVAVGTARYDFVPVVLELLNGPPEGSPFEDADHVVETDIELPSGKLVITGGTQLPSEVEPLCLAPGQYRLRVRYMPTINRPPCSSEYAPGDYLEYRIEVWLVHAPSGVNVVKQGPALWAG